MILKRQAKPTFTPFNLGLGDSFQFVLSSGNIWEMTLLETSGEVLSRCRHGGVAKDPGHQQGDIASYGFSALVKMNGREHLLRRVVGTQESFYEPWVIDGVQLWLDAVACVFMDAGGFMGEKDWRPGQICMPQNAARFAVQESNRSICPEAVSPWYPNSTGRIDISDCYTGEDCWMGPYSGGAAHCGLDVNMAAGTPIIAPIALDDHYLFNSVEAGFRCNRWRGIRHWPDGSQWQLQCHHLLEMWVPERTALAAGTAYAAGAGTAVGLHEHSHFMFQVIEQGGQYWLDPWILFWQAFQN